MPTPRGNDTHAADSWSAWACYAAEGAGQSDRKSLPSVRSVFFNLSCVGAVEVVVFSTHGIVTCFFLLLLTLNAWFKKRNICANSFFFNCSWAQKWSGIHENKKR